MSAKEQPQQSAVRAWLHLHPYAAARLITWPLIGGLLLIFYFALS